MEISLVHTYFYKRNKLAEFSGDLEANILDNCTKLINNNIDIAVFDIKVSDSYAIKVGKKIRQLCSLYDMLFFVKSRCDIAYLVKADGVILDDCSISPIEARKIISSTMLIGATYQVDESDFLLSDKYIKGVKYLFVKSKNNLYLRKNGEED